MALFNHCSYSFVHTFIQTISIAPLQVHSYSEALPTHHEYCAGASRQSATGNCKLRTCPRSLPKWRLERDSNISKGFDTTNAPPRPTLRYINEILMGSNPDSKIIGLGSKCH